ncbi:MAG: hypothetical protein LH468_02095 [Nocardioides sp.]|nr:hypothetical protein [Nocardioides sp.]
MQLLPSTWRSARVDADGDGRRDPQDVDDAALAVAVVLCSPPHDLRRRTARVAALRLLNARPSFVTAVLRARHTFMGPPSGPVGPVALVRLGATDAAAPSSAIREPGPVATAQGDAKPEAEAAAAAAAAAPLIGTATPEGCSDPPPTTPAPAPSPAPEPTPAPLPAGFVEATPTASLTATSSPTPNPTPSGDPAANPDAVVSGVPTDLPTTLPTTLPTDAATAPPTAPPTALPTALSSASPEAAPTPDPPLLRLSARARAVGCR